MHIGILYFQVTGILQFFFLNRRLKNIIQRIHKIFQITCLCFKRSLTTLNPCHLKNIINQRQQKRTGMLDLTDIINHPFLIIQVLFQKICKPYDCIHRCTDIMAHIKQKTCLCLICHSCLYCRFFQFFFMQNIFIPPHFVLPVSNRSHHCQCN